MTQLDLIPFRREWRRWASCFAVLAALALVAASPGQLTNQSTDAAAGSTVAPAPAKAAPATALLTADTRTMPEPSVGEPQRRLLMLLLVHSAGPLGPYGALGR
ncbi:MAG TPA: hypothetical protein VN668_22660 [Stellaceae bacterium]|nr:hypothetical protein [Stellaceae bacterium]